MGRTKKKLEELKVGYFGLTPEDKEKFSELFPGMKEIDLYKDEDYDLMLFDQNKRDPRAMGFLLQDKGTPKLLDIPNFEKERTAGSLEITNYTLISIPSFFSSLPLLQRPVMEYKLIGMGLAIDANKADMKAIAWRDWLRKREED